RETEDILNTSQQKLTETEKERDILLRQLSLNAPQVCIRIIRFVVLFFLCYTFIYDIQKSRQF
ncbi:unnamed protein product, partial [Rotaria socialis]